MDFLQFYLGQAASACLIQVLVFRRWHQSAAASTFIGTFVSGALWYPAFFFVKHAEWGWKTGPIDFSLEGALLLFFAWIIFSCYALPVAAISGWLCNRFKKRTTSAFSAERHR